MSRLLSYLYSSQAVPEHQVDFPEHTSTSVPDLGSDPPFTGELSISRSNSAVMEGGATDVHAALESHPPEEGITTIETETIQTSTLEDSDSDQDE